MDWINRNKKLLVLLVLAFVALQIFQALFGVSLFNARPGAISKLVAPRPALEESRNSFGTMTSPAMGIAQDSYLYDPAPMSPESVSTAQDRKVIADSNLSLLVNDVRDIGQKVVDYVQKEGGFMVQTNYNRPTESPFGTVVVRVPSEKLSGTLEYFRGLAVKVTSESLVGTDVTDQYENVSEKLAILETTKNKFEAILASASTVQDTLTVQREILNIQAQIDSLMGRKDALEKNAAFSKVTIYLSTDELALPYTPDTTFRPAVTFKLAIRNLLGSLRTLGEWAIWIGVYAVIWVPALIIIIVARRYWVRRQKRV